MAQLKDLIVSGDSRFVGNVYGASTLNFSTISTNALTTATMTINGTGTIVFTDTGATSGQWRGIYGTVGNNDDWVIRGSQTAANAGYLEIATGDDANEPIYVRQYSGHSYNNTPGTNAARTLTLLDASGNTIMPGTLNVTGGLTVNSGLITSTSSDRYLTIGCQNDSYCHYTTDATLGHWFNRSTYVAGSLYKGSSYNLNVPAVFIQSSTPTASQTGDIWFS